MSGSSYSRSSYLGGSFDVEENFDCSTLNIVTQVVSPTMAYFKYITVSEIFDVKLDDEIVVLINSQEDTVGAVNPLTIEKLIECIKKKKSYKAEIVSINGGDIRVRISLLSN